ncbi:MAG TPA: DUF4304 domain-containing protein [Candidatus Limnocylindria bacterium]|jgi:hypothetical protein|nr:DUF4304 domain-containing protein [Candidatus Limnocylindria bacterium]
MASQVGPTAQAVYADMLRTEIAPRLRGLGFKGSGSSYVLPDDDRWLIVAFQKTYYSRKDCVRFTVNLTVADKRDWAEARVETPSLPFRPTGNAHYMETEMAVIRLGNLMPPDGQDRWWKVGPRRPGGQPAKRILKAIERLAIPWFQTGAARWPEMARGY